MKHKALEDNNDEVLELDRLVAQELRAYQVSGKISGMNCSKQIGTKHKKSKVCSNKSQKIDKATERSNQVTKCKNYTHQGRNTGRISREAEESRDKSGEIFEDQLMGHPVDTDIPERNSLVLSEEDETFVNNTVAWLSRRENKDVLMSAIWDRLIESTPDRYFSPEPDFDNKILNEHEYDKSVDTRGDNRP